MKREVLKTLLDAAEQAPESPQLRKALRLTRKQLAKAPEMVRPQDYDVALANTGRALECIADGLRWAGEIRAKGGGQGETVAGVARAKSEGDPVAAALNHG